MDTSALAITSLRIHHQSSCASVQDTNSLHSKKGKGIITPRPDTSGLGVTEGPL